MICFSINLCNLLFRWNCRLLAVDDGNKNREFIEKLIEYESISLNQKSLEKIIIIIIFVFFEKLCWRLNWTRGFGIYGKRISSIDKWVSEWNDEECMKHKCVIILLLVESCGSLWCVFQKFRLNILITGCRIIFVAVLKFIPLIIFSQQICQNFNIFIRHKELK
jgi:hypothetical protein